MSECCAKVLLLLAFLAALAPGAHALEDPTRPPGYGEQASSKSAPQRPRWQLTSTLIAPARRVANINGKPVHQGERIDGATLVEVHASHVVLRHQGKRLVLSLLPREFKRMQGAR